MIPTIHPETWENDFGALDRAYVTLAPHDIARAVKYLGTGWDYKIWGEVFPLDGGGPFEPVPSLFNRLVIVLAHVMLAASDVPGNDDQVPAKPVLTELLELRAKATALGLF